MPDHASARLHKDLLLALESARTRLAVAMAAETKSTPPDRWQYYLETTDRMCRCIKKLRKARVDIAPAPEDWAGALDALQQLPVYGKAFRLCQIIRGVVSGLE